MNIEATQADESVGRTMLIAVAVALACSAMVSTAVYFLRPMQAAYAQLERNTAIVQASGQMPNSEGEREIVGAYLSLEARVLDLATGRLTTEVDGRAYDHWDAEAETLATLPDGAKAVGLTQVPRYVPVYVADDGRIVLPVHGRGMWSTIYGYVALAEDRQTIAAVDFFKHGETPGIGDRIQDENWLASWTGKRLYTDDQRVALVVSNDASIPADRRIDAISGATVTSEAVGRIVRFWSSVYAPLLGEIQP